MGVEAYLSLSRRVKGVGWDGRLFDAERLLPILPLGRALI